MKKKRLLQILCCGILLAASVGCYSIRYEVADLPNSVILDNDNAKTTYHFTENSRHFYVLWGLLPIIKPSMDSVLEKHAQSGRIKNLSIKQEMEPFDLALRIIGSYVLGLSSFSVNYEGDVVKGGRR